MKLTKICKKCNKEKTLDLFHKSKRHYLGVKDECAICVNAYLRRHYACNPRTDEQKRQLTSAHLMRKYGINIEEYQILYNSQLGKCLICKTFQKSLYNTRISKGKKEILVVDHDASTGRIRGLLCQECNQAIGLMKHDPQVLYNAINYLGEF